MDLTISFKLEGYEILSKIPSHSARDLFIAESKKLGKKVVIKSISTLDEMDASVINLRNEFELIQFLKDDINLQVFEIVKHNSGFALVMEYIEGNSLKDLLVESVFPLETFFPIVLEVVERIQKIHNRKVIHKDIKPDNILISNQTKKVVIIDFGISTKLTKQESNWTSPNILEGSIPYISPEQTGRMNRSIDYRTDFYSLGVSFYEMLTGRLPFVSDDLLEVVHSHLAKVPDRPDLLVTTIPTQLANLIMKLMAKNAEDRYQSCRSLLADLQRAYNEWKENGTISTFELGANDFSEEFKIPQKLYGREKEVNTLISEFEVTQNSGRSKLILIGGYSGVGKSSLVKEIYKPMTQSHGYFITGKYDQYNRNIPYSAVISAFTGMIKFILTESPESIQNWKNKIHQALGSNGGLITEVIPELEIIIGKQQEVPPLSPQENANRFYTVFQNFIKVFADQKHPLAIFFDDLQWADNASLEIIKNLLTDSSVNYLFMIMAYRDNEVDKVHPFALFLNSLKEEGVQIESLNLQALALEDVNQLLSDALHSNKEKTIDLAKIIFSKTGGNPFFIGELLKQLTMENLISLNKSGNYEWFWDVEKIKASDISDNVVQLLLKRIKKLNEHSQEILKLSACIGSNFDLTILTGLTGLELTTIATGLLETISEELILPLNDSYRKLERIQKEKEKVLNNHSKEIRFKFQHDRILSASYEKLEEKEKQETHLSIARILLGNKSISELEDSLFDIVSHLNQSLELINQETELNKAIEVNVRAAKKAKLSSAYKPALEMIRAAHSLQKRSKDSTFRIIILRELGELEYLNGNLDGSEKYTKQALELSNDPIEKAEIYNLLITQYSARGEFGLAFESINKALEPLGINLPSDDFSTILNQEIEKSREIIGTRKISELIKLPEMTDPKKSAAVNILIGAIPTAYNKIPALFPLLGVKMVNLHLEHGNLPDSYGYAMYGIIMNGFSEFQKCYDFCNLAVNVSEQFKNPSGITKASNILANYSIPFVRHLKFSEEVNNKCVKSSLESGELLHGSYGAMNDAINIFYQGKRLEKISEKLESLYSYAKKVKNNLSIDTIEAVRVILPNLLGETDSHLEFKSEAHTEEEFIKVCEEHQSLFSVCLYKIMKAKSLLVYGESRKALDLLEETKPMLAFISGQYSLTEFIFLESLALTQCYRQFGTDKRKEIIERVKDNQKKLKIYATSCVENYMHKYLFIEAELARINYKNWKAAKYYDDAITQSRKYDFIQNEAHFLELAGNFWFSKSNPKIGSQYILDAHLRYKQWGAFRKAEMLANKYPDYLGDGKKISSTISRPVPGQGGKATQTELYTGQNLDIQSVLKSSNAISGEIKLESLLKKLIEIVMENAGAEKGILLLNQNGNLTVDALGDVKTGEVKMIPGVSIQAYQDLPISIIYYVMRTKENLVLSNCASDDRFRVDPYIFKNKTLSVLCAPIIKHGDITGVLYLENNLAEGAFTADRLQIVSMLSSQAAISLDNAILYNSLEEKVAERTKQLAEANDELEEKNQHITDSINYAKNIQTAILPIYESLKKAFKDIFVLYRPKDIVSGDFFWFSQIGEAKLVAAVDCTGHGVPGALMSMIGNTLLNQIVNESKILDPGAILTQLNKNVRAVLKQETEDANSTDGMDMCICKLEGETLYFAGAKRPILIATNNGFQEIKGDRYSIGGRQNGERNFTTQTISIPKDERMVVYLTTDGFVDQPNVDRARIGSRGLQNEILGNFMLSAAKQEAAFHEKLKSHSGEEPQRDDITIVGIVLS
ncbi:MAG: AAA family ATPase [Leptospiraceae bacterium]|nr:AAA family ATPase [Leptospiraceae bacterium]